MERAASASEVARRAGVDVAGYPRHFLTLRNRATPLEVRVIQEARKLARTVPAT